MASEHFICPVTIYLIWYLHRIQTITQIAWQNGFHCIRFLPLFDSYRNIRFHRLSSLLCFVVWPLLQFQNNDAHCSLLKHTLANTVYAFNCNRGSFGFNKRLNEWMYMNEWLKSMSRSRLRNSNTNTHIHPYRMHENNDIHLPEWFW